MRQAGVFEAYGYALRRGYLFSVLYLSVQVLAYAALVPAIGGLIALAVSLSDQAALTDQDIAGFLMRPAGMAAGIGVLAVLLVAEVLGFALSAAAQRSAGGIGAVLRGAYGHVVAHLGQLLLFAALFVLRVLVMVAPFAGVALWLFATRLTDYDINYYLSHRPPEFLRTGALIGAIVLAGAVLLLTRLSGWVLAVHLILFTEIRAPAAFGASADRTRGQRGAILRRIGGWLILRLLAAGGIGLVLGGLANLVPLGGSLRLALSLVMLAGLIWGLANLVLNAVSLAALARLIDTSLPEAERQASEPPALAHPALGTLVLSALAAGGLIGGAWLLGGVSPKDDAIIIAHRGGAIHRPENTVAAIEHGIEAGADWIEIDVQETADGEIAVIHDSDFMKIAGVDLKIWGATAQDLSQIDIGSRFDAAYAGERTPMLRDVLEQVRDRALLLIELKYYGHDVDLERRVAELVDAAGMGDQVAVMSLKYPAVQKMQALRPDWTTGVLAATAIGDLTGLDGDFVAISTVTATPRRIREADRAGKALYVWTVNDALEMSRMLSRGVDGLITDDPGLARQVLAVRAGLSTPERLLLTLADMLGLEARE